MALQEFRITTGDTIVPLRAQLTQDIDGVSTIVDLTPYTIKFHMTSDNGVSVIAETTTGVTVISAVSGEVQFDFSVLQVATAGVYWGWFVAYDLVGESLTFPTGRGLKITIVDDN